MTFDIGTLPLGASQTCTFQVRTADGVFTGIVTGNSSTCAVLQDTMARCWGYNLGGQLGVRVEGNSAGPTVWGSTVS